MSITRGPLRRIVVAFLLGAAFLAPAAVHVPAAEAAPGTCSSWWAHVRGSQSTGACRGASGGTHFRVVQECGERQAVTYSAWTWAPNGAVVYATTSPCPASAPDARSAWVEW
ncbi:hypothetical protein [Modestobacter sp. I12A-02662]|uniref:hypothetical protein n=1 Tax=Modestobacter sp. I12A-02662 TaxID=1730496 RepID=UPI0034DF71B0